MADCCIKVYTLEKVLKVKRDPVTDIVFLEEAMKVCDWETRFMVSPLTEHGRSWKTVPAPPSGLH